MLQSFAKLPPLEPLGWAVAHSLWQGALIALAVAITFFAFPPSRPQFRYAIAYASLLLMLFVPAGTALLVDTAASIDAANYLWEKSEVGSARQPVDGAGRHVTEPAPSGASVNAPPPATTGSPAGPPPQPAWPSAIALAWLCGVSISAIRLIRDHRMVCRVWRGQAHQAPRQWQQRVADLAARLGMGRLREAIRLLESRDIDVPMVIGALRPVILVPVGLLANLTPQEVDHILSHELAHIRRHDYLLNLVQVVIERLLFYHPAAWWLARQINLERECCCDRAAADLTDGPREYTKTLVSLETQRSQLPAALVVAATGIALRTRIERLNGMPAQPVLRSRRFWIYAACLAAVFVATWGIAWYPAVQRDVVSFPTEEDAAARALPERPAHPSISFGTSAAPIPMREMPGADLQPPEVEIGAGQSFAILRKLPDRTGPQRMRVWFHGAALHIKIIPKTAGLKPFLVAHWTGLDGRGTSDSVSARDSRGYAHQSLEHADNRHPVTLDVRRDEHVIEDEVLLGRRPGGGEEYLIWLWVPEKPADWEPNHLGPEAAKLRLDEWGQAFLEVDPYRWLSHRLPGTDHPGDVDTFQIRARWPGPLTFTASGRGSSFAPHLRIFDAQGRLLGSNQAIEEAFTARVTLDAAQGQLFYCAVTAPPGTRGGKYKLYVDQLQARDKSRSP